MALIGISGHARVGKDTFAGMLAAELNKEAYPPYVMMAFANELKLRCQAAFDLTWEQLWGDDKEKEDKRYIKHFTTMTDTQNDGSAVIGLYWTAREIMQNYGAFYRTIDSEFWVKNLFKVVQEKEYTNVIITDVRYINEADYIIDNGGYVIRIERANKDDVHNMLHPSEVELDGYKRFSFNVINDWGLEELKEAASDVAGFFKELEKKFKNLKEIKVNG